MAIEEILQKIVNLDRASLVKLAEISINDIMKSAYINEIASTDENKVTVIIAAIIAGIGADGVLSVKEKSFVAEIFGVSEETVSQLAHQYSQKTADLVDGIADNAEVETKAAIVQLVATVAACDETIVASETAFIKKLLA